MNISSGQHINVGLELRRGKKRFGEKMVLDSSSQDETNTRQNIRICKVLARGAIPSLPTYCPPRLVSAKFLPSPRAGGVNIVHVSHVKVLEIFSLKNQIIYGDNLHHGKS